MQIVEEKNEVHLKKIESDKGNNRLEGIELLRILCMYMVLLLHYSSNKNFLEFGAVLVNTDRELAWIIESFSIVAVNCFVLISGYFLVNSKCNKNNLLKIISQVLFYSISILIIAEMFLDIDLSLKTKLQSILPITLCAYWFITCYIVLYLLAPFINKILKYSSKREIEILIIILIAVSFASSFLYSLDYNAIDRTNGYGIIWFITLYCIAGYIRLYVNENYNKYKYLGSYIFMSIIIYLTRIIIGNLNTYSSNIFYNYNSILVAFSSICLFMFFKNVKINNDLIKSIILKIAPLTLAVYIIHENLVIKDVIWNNLMIKTDYFVVNIFLNCLVIFVLCCGIEYLRMKLFKYLKNFKK